MFIPANAKKQTSLYCEFCFVVTSFLFTITMKINVVKQEAADKHKNNTMYAGSPITIVK